MIIAIDGPAASGKSTVARKVARRLSFYYMDTGAMYRALTWKALEEKIDLSNDEALGLLSKACQISFSSVEDDHYHVFLNGQDVTEQIRDPKVSAAVSRVSKVPAVRTDMVKKQRALAVDGVDLVAEGRDIGTVVFPDAELKIFLTAGAAERARRRQQELKPKGYDIDMVTVERDIIARDKTDAGRSAGPLAKAADAVIIDTTGKTIEQVVREIVALVEKS